MLRLLSSAVLGLLLGSALVSGQANQGANPSVAPPGNPSLIYQDFTTLVGGAPTSISLPYYNSSLANQATSSPYTTYSTSGPGHFSFGVDWVGDQDTVVFSYPYPLPNNCQFSLTVINQPPQPGCTPAFFPGTTNFGVVLNQTIPACNFTASWTCSFKGQFAVTYKNDTNTDAITIGFVQSTITGDPQFVGLRGQSYQVHGIDGAVYNIISEQNTQVNSRFAFLTQGQCPVVDGAVQDNCWSHPGSYLGEMSFQQVVEGKAHAALVTAGPASSGFAAVQMDGKALKVGTTVTFGTFSLTYTGAYSVLVRTEHFDFELSNSDLFINQAVRSRVPLSKLRAHGLLGQTSNSATYNTPLRYIAGQVDDYVIQDNDIFGNDFVYNLYKA